MGYDHNDKAGNAGDVAKHPALMAAVCATLRSCNSHPLRYADLYAGYYTSTLSSRGWMSGIGRLKRRRSSNEFVGAWLKHVAASPAAGDPYPGSTQIAHDAAALVGGEIPIAAFDTASAAVRDLR